MAISGANLAEVLSTLAEIGADPHQVTERLRLRGLLGGTLDVLPLTMEDAVMIADLHPEDKVLRAIARRSSLLGPQASPETPCHHGGPHVVST